MLTELFKTPPPKKKKMKTGKEKINQGFECVTA